MKQKIAKLIDVKSIVTLLLTLVFCILALLGVIGGTEFLTIFTIVIGFYFGTQHQKKVQAEGSAEPTGTVAENTTDIEKLNLVHDEAIQGELQPPNPDSMHTIGFKM